MKHIVILALTLAFNFAFAESPEEIQVDQCKQPSKTCTVGEDQVATGTRTLVTCETNPSTPENVIVVYCYEQDGEAVLSPRHAEIEPGGC